jgi:ubiquinone/menaquinone biosynthesis C-methylase UbiE
MTASTQLFDQETARNLEAVYLTPDVVAQRRATLEALQPAAGERILDIGSGPGLLAHDLAAAVGPRGRVCGIDTSEPMLAMSARRCAAQPWAEFRPADATQLPYPDAGFDAAVSTQVYEYVPDIPAALADLHRVLRPGGRAVIVDTDYGSLVIYTEDKARMARVLAAWNEHFVHAELPRTLSRQLRDAGFALRRREVIPMFNPEYDPDTYSHGLLALMASFVVGRQGVTKEEAAAWHAEFANLGRQGRYFFSLNRYLFAAEKPRGPATAGNLANFE